MQGQRQAARVRLGRVRAQAASAAVAAVTMVVFAAGCGGAGTGGISSGGDTVRGEELFKQQCGGCHTLAAAGTAGVIGPNLDDAFAADREQGFEESSIQQVVAGQIKYPPEGDRGQLDVRGRPRRCRPTS